MSIIVKMRKQKAVWWQREATPDEFGAYTFADPVEIACRWDDLAKEFLDPQGETQTSRAIVYTDRVMKPGDKLLEGPLESGTSMGDAFEVRQFGKTPNLKATETLFTAYL